MVDSLGTRTRQNAQRMKVEQGTYTRYRMADKGMKKRVAAALTFTASDGKVTGAASTFANNFAALDPVMITGTNLNNSFHKVVSTDASTFLVLDPPPKDEGPVTCTIRTP